VNLGRASARGVEGLLGVGGRRQRVALEHGDVVTGAIERERRPESRDASPDYDDMLRHYALPATLVTPVTKI
jgi:hypothetical protein